MKGYIWDFLGEGSHNRTPYVVRYLEQHRVGKLHVVSSIGVWVF